MKPIIATAATGQTTAKTPWISRGEALAKVEALEAELATLKASQAPAAAIARQVETAARTTANELSAARREAAPVAAKPAPELTGLARTVAAFQATAKPEAPRPNRADTRERTGLEKATAAFKAAAQK